MDNQNQQSSDLGVSQQPQVQPQQQLAPQLQQQSNYNQNAQVNNMPQQIIIIKLGGFLLALRIIFLICAIIGIVIIWVLIMILMMLAVMDVNNATMGVISMSGVLGEVAASMITLVAFLAGCIAVSFMAASKIKKRDGRIYDILVAFSVAISAMVIVSSILFSFNNIAIVFVIAAQLWWICLWTAYFSKSARARIWFGSNIVQSSKFWNCRLLRALWSEPNQAQTTPQSPSTQGQTTAQAPLPPKPTSSTKSGPTDSNSAK